MALTDIAGDDLDEMLREEAEDVFYEDGRLANEEGWAVWKQARAHRWRWPGSGWLECDGGRRKEVKAMLAEGRPGGISSAAARLVLV